LDITKAVTDQSEMTVIVEHLSFLKEIGGIRWKSEEVQK
jgi:hypothetical protein